ncbi:hypothetical protein WJX82_005794 [Trebouxia sp. C0006]|jgi:hypothetical protein
MVLQPFTSVAPIVAGMAAAAYALFYTQNNYKIFGGAVASKNIASWKPEHIEATRRRMFNMEREAAPDDPVILNPFRHNIPATVKNAANLSGPSEA